VTVSCSSLSEQDETLVFASPATLKAHAQRTSFESVVNHLTRFNRVKLINVHTFWSYLKKAKLLKFIMVWIRRSLLNMLLKILQTFLEIFEKMITC